MARILVSDPNWFGFEIERGGEAEGGEKFGDVFCFSGECLGGSVFRFVGSEKMMVFLERGAAAGGVGDDGVEAFVEECGDIFSDEAASDVANSGMRGKRAAAKLSVGDDDFATVGGENADGGVIELREGDVGDAAGEEGDTGTWLIPTANTAGADGGKGLTDAGEEKRIVDAREETFAIGEAEKFEDAGRASEFLQAGALVDTEKARDRGDAGRKRKEMSKNKIARVSREKWARVVSFNFGASVFNELAVFDAGGAGGFAGAAVEAFIDVFDEGIGDGLVIEFDVNHLADASARGVGLEIPEAVSGASVEAESAMGAASKIFVNGGGAGDGGGSHAVVGGRRRFYGSWEGVAREEWEGANFRRDGVPPPPALLWDVA